jgi:hypothetical protein
MNAFKCIFIHFVSSLLKKQHLKGFRMWTERNLKKKNIFLLYNKFFYFKKYTATSIKLLLLLFRYYSDQHY